MSRAGTPPARRPPASPGAQRPRRNGQARGAPEGPRSRDQEEGGRRLEEQRLQPVRLGHDLRAPILARPARRMVSTRQAGTGVEMNAISEKEIDELIDGKLDELTNRKLDESIDR